MEALERAVDPEKYIVGPGDIFSFNVWGIVDRQIPIPVSPEGKLLVPSVGEIEVDGKTLEDVQSLVLSQAATTYENSKISLTLEALRVFRVHVVGEVEYPSTYVAQAVDRISEMIVEAGGVTERGWKRGIELRHPDGTRDYFDLTAFEQEGDLSQNLFVNGGDVVYVPPIGVGKDIVNVEGDLENSGTYKIYPGEKLLGFLQRIRVLKRNTDLSRIRVLRSDKRNGEGSQRELSLYPFSKRNSIDLDFSLQDGDRVILPQNYVYVKGAVRNPGPYPFVLNLTAKDYAGMAGGDYRSGSIKSVRVYHVRDGKTEKGPDVLVEAGDIVHLNPSWNHRFENYIRIIPVITSLIIAAKVAGVFGE